MQFSLSTPNLEQEGLCEELQKWLTLTSFPSLELESEMRIVPMSAWCGTIPIPPQLQAGMEGGVPLVILTRGQWDIRCGGAENCGTIFMACISV